MKTPNAKIIGLVDCNNFFVSCERVFDPTLIGKPTLVLSSNDGCVVARSKEARDLGIPMGIPVFKIKEIIKKEKIQLRSGNLELYYDMSSRVMNILREFIDTIEVYSIDEAFLDLTKYKDPVKVCKNLSQKITQYTGIPVSIGIANTKTLAKLANKISKKNQEVFYIKNQADDKISNWQDALEQTKINDVWGIGKKTTEKLQLLQINNAYDFQKQNIFWIKKNFGSTGVDIANELRGSQVHTFQEIRNKRKSIISSRSFGKGVIDFQELATSLIRHVENATKQLRQDDLKAQKITFYVSTGLFQKSGKYIGKETVTFDYPTDDTFKIIKEVEPTLKRIYKEGFIYKKSGVCLSEIVGKNQIYHNNLFGNCLDENEKINQTMDKLNARYGSNTIKIASSNLNLLNSSGPKKTESTASLSEYKSNKFTTEWDQILCIK